ncbi:MAG TPA: copper resistance protein CopC [Candidatus Dormibacteraeota bacterium]|nr:copper resistance protein CopC [Candidatus Dormibacteraeota bacterium]
MTARKLLAAAAIAAAVAIGLPVAASAHALLRSSQPANGATVDRAPAVVVLTFTETPDVHLSSATIIDTGGAQFAGGPVGAVAGDPDSLALPVRTLPRGVYTVSWRTVSTVDGHLAAGSFAFGVQVAAASVTATASVVGGGSPGVGWPTIAGRGLLYAGLIGLLGAAVVALWVAGPVAPVLRMLAGAAAVVALGTAASILGELRDAGIGLDDALGSSLGTAIVERTVAAGVALLGAGLVAVRPARVAGIAVSGLGAAGGMLADALASHANAGGTAAEVVAQWAHIAAAGVWIGGLAALLLSVGALAAGTRAPAVRRFSLVATGCIAVVAASGSIRAISSLSAWSQLWDTGYGRLLLAKIGLLALLAGLGAVNHFAVVPAIPRRVRLLRRVGAAELVAATTAVAVAGALVNLAPPSSAAAAGTGPVSEPPLVLTGSDFAETTRLRLEIAPGTPGFDRFTLTAADFDSGAPVDGTATLRFSLPGGGLGDSTLALPRVSPGTYSTTGGNLAVAGTWRVEALVQQAATSADVLMQLTTRTAPERVSISRAPGQPTIYTVDQGQGRSVQLYLDSEKPGISHLHATYFDASGSELPVPAVTITAAENGGAARQLAIQRIDAGHVSGQLTLERASYRFQVAARTATGDTLTVHLDLTITAEGASPAPSGP